jgi:hypothetical protein
MSATARLLAIPVIAHCILGATARAHDTADVAGEVRVLRERLDAQEETIRQQQALLASLQRAPPQESRTANRAGLDAEVQAYLQSVSGEDISLRYGSASTLVSTHGFLHALLTDTAETHSEFDLHHVYLFFQTFLKEYAEAWIEVEFEHGSEKIELDQAEIRLTPFDLDLTLAMGRFYAPFGVERFTWYHPTSELVTRPVAFRQVVPGNWYETGVRA